MFVSNMKVIGSQLYQWESGRKLQINPLPNMRVDAVHFSNFGDTEALVVMPREENGVIVADIPNIMLQSGRNIVVYTVNVSADSVETLLDCTFAVRNRAKPSDYVYQETEVYTIKTAVEKAINEAKESGEFDGEKGEKGDPGEKGEKGDKGDPGELPIQQFNELYANILKGTTAGGVAGIHDASPFEHEMSVKLSSEAITDFSNVKVRKYPSKNYAPYERVEFERVDQTFVFNEPLEVGKTYRFTADVTSTFDGKCVMSLVPGGQQLFVSQGIGATITFDVPNVGCTGFWLYSAPTWGETVGHTAIYDRISVVEECTPTEHTPTADGIVSGIISNGEPMTIITDNPNTTITAEYNQDTNKVIKNIVQAIVSLGGNV